MSPGAKMGHPRALSSSFFRQKSRQENRDRELYSAHGAIRRLGLESCAKRNTDNGDAGSASFRILFGGRQGNVERNVLGELYPVVMQPNEPGVVNLGGSERGADARIHFGADGFSVFFRVLNAVHDLTERDGNKLL